MLTRKDDGWEAVDAFAPAFWDVFKIITAFTVAHSITLRLATLGVVTLPSRWVESAIALSVVLAALNNLFPVVRGKRWLMAFVFGLIHGCGFASVLADLGLRQGTLLTALVAFNLSVEAGQLAIVSAFLPVAFLIRSTVFYRRAILVGGSALIVLVACVWLVERAADVRVIAARVGGFGSQRALSDRPPLAVGVDFAPLKRVQDQPEPARSVWFSRVLRRP